MTIFRTGDSVLQLLHGSCPAESDRPLAALVQNATYSLGRNGTMQKFSGDCHPLNRHRMPIPSIPSPDIPLLIYDYATGLTTFESHIAHHSSEPSSQIKAIARWNSSTKCDRLQVNLGSSGSTIGFAVSQQARHNILLSRCASRRRLIRMDI